MSIFKDLGINFSKEPKEVQETKRLIKESEDKRDALIQSLVQEEDRIIASNKEHFIAIGEYVYNNYDKVKSSGFAQEVEDNYNFIKENEEKLKEISVKKDDVNKRYNDEIDILRLNLKNYEEQQRQEESQKAQAANQVEFAESDGKFCSNCGAKNTLEARFCGNCGAKLD